MPVTYVVSNPSSYGYPDENRPDAAGKEFRAFGDARNCTTYDRWPYGLAGRVGYSASLSDEQMRKQLVSRPTVYLLGGLDILPLAGYSSCPAMAQGPTRLARGESFAAYMRDFLFITPIKKFFMKKYFLKHVDKFFIKIIFGTKRRKKFLRRNYFITKV